MSEGNAETAGDAEREEDACVRLFLSVDLVGSTAFKNSSEADTGKGQGPLPWTNVFKEFYQSFPRMFAKKVDGHKLEAALRPSLVKAIGDELLFQVEIQSCLDASAILRFFAKALGEYSVQQLKDHPKLRLKGTAWIAGFPINNYRIPFFDEHGKPSQVDFIGPSMDTGFRIAKFATPLKLVVAVDLALLTLTSEQGPKLRFDGTQDLRGVLSGRPYPIFWTKVDGRDKVLQDAELALLEGNVGTDEAAQLKYCEAYVASCDGTWLHRPYLGNDSKFAVIPEWHIQRGAVIKQVDEQNYRDEPKGS